MSESERASQSPVMAITPIKGNRDYSQSRPSLPAWDVYSSIFLVPASRLATWSIPPSLQRGAWLTVESHEADTVPPIQDPERDELRKKEKAKISPRIQRIRTATPTLEKAGGRGVSADATRCGFKKL